MVEISLNSYTQREGSVRRWLFISQEESSDQKPTLTAPSSGVSGYYNCKNIFSDV
jgi:hypothetical protein